MIKCGNCNDGHETVADVRRCHGVQEETPWPASDKQIAYVVGLQKERDLPDEYVVVSEDALRRMDRAEVSRLINELKVLPYKAPKAKVDKSAAQSIPPGYYALQHPETSAWMFFEITQGKPPRWEGYTFIKRLIGAPGDYRKDPVPAHTRNELIAHIAEDPEKASKDYGKQSGRCGLCRSPLTDPVSLERGIGPICAGKAGW